MGCAPVPKGSGDRSPLLRWGTPPMFWYSGWAAEETGFIAGVQGVYIPTPVHSLSPSL